MYTGFYCKRGRTDYLVYFVAYTKGKSENLLLNLPIFFASVERIERSYNYVFILTEHLTKAKLVFLYCVNLWETITYNRYELGYE